MFGEFDTVALAAREEPTAMGLHLDHQCPCCFRPLVHSRFRWYEWPLVCLLLRPFRCPSCLQRYVRRIW
jgi:hypothetical protein